MNRYATSTVLNFYRPCYKGLTLKDLSGLEKAISTFLKDGDAAEQHGVHVHTASCIARQEDHSTLRIWIAAVYALRGQQPCLNIRLGQNAPPDRFGVDPTVVPPGAIWLSRGRAGCSCRVRAARTIRGRGVMMLKFENGKPTSTKSPRILVASNEQLPCTHIRTSSGPLA